LLRFLVGGVIDPTWSESLHDGAVGDAAERSEWTQTIKDMARPTSMISGSGLLGVSQHPVVKAPCQLTSPSLECYHLECREQATNVSKGQFPVQTPRTVVCPRHKTACSA
jgi:hypothetical protein